VKGTIVGVFTDGVGSCSVKLGSCTIDEIAPGTTVPSSSRWRHRRQPGSWPTRRTSPPRTRPSTPSRRRSSRPSPTGRLPGTPPAFDVSATPDQSSLPAHAVNAVRVAVNNPTADDAHDIAITAKNVKNGGDKGMSRATATRAGSRAPHGSARPTGIAAGDTWHGTVEVQGTAAGTTSGEVNACSALDSTLCVSEPFQYTDTGPCVQPAKHFDGICPDQPDAPLDVHEGAPTTPNVPVGSIVNYTISVHNSRTVPAQRRSSTRPVGSGRSGRRCLASGRLRALRATDANRAARASSVSSRPARRRSSSSA